MALVRIERFGGIVPKVDEKRLPENCAVEAINVDLQGFGIKPVYATLFKRNANTNNPASANPSSTIAQFPTACLVTVGRTTGAGYVSFAPPIPGYVLVADDELVYSVLLPAGATIAGQGCIDLRFTDATTLGNVNDQNAIGSLTGNITAQAQGVWYTRRISLATAAGKVVSEVRFYHNYTNDPAFTAYFGMAYVRDSVFGTQKQMLFDVDQQLAGTPSAFPVQSYLSTIDEDEAPLIGSDHRVASSLDQTRVFAICPAQFDGPPRSRHLLIQHRAMSSAIYGWAGHDRGYPYDNQISPARQGLHTLQSNYAWGSSAGATFQGWVAVTKPTAAMSLAVVGGAPPTVTRAYVYTRVSEDGLESGPSPAVEVTGNRDGTWQLTNITAWTGTDGLSKLRSRGKKRIYRTPEGSDTYRFVAEIDAETVTTLNDLALDAALGEDLPTADYQDPPKASHGCTWRKGMLGIIIEETQVGFCVPYQYHAWPLTQRYTIPYAGVATGAVGDRFIALTKGKPIAFSGESPDELLWSEFQQGEACIGVKSVISADVGVIYPGRTGWGLIDYNGYQNITREFLDSATYAAIVSEATVACFDNRKLHWITQGATQGYSFEFGAAERSLTKFQVPDPLYAMSYYGPRDTRWVVYTNGGVVKIGKLFGDTAQKLKWTWRSKLIRFPEQVNLKVAQIDSNEWDTLSANMKNREAAYKTGGGGAPYTISIAGLTQAEPWCYLKVWARADQGADKVLIYDDFVVSSKPVRLARGARDDCYQVEIQGNMAISSIAMAESEKELNAE